jgi:hypothetical protein
MAALFGSRLDVYFGGLFITVRPTPMNVLSLWDDDPRGLAARAVEIARALCTCGDRYHVLWPLLRVAGVKGNLRPGEDEVLSRIVRRLAGNGTRFLIAGSADTATFCTVGRMAGASRPDYAVLDRCAAPLSLIQEFAAERRISCRTVHADLCEFGGEGNWDVVLMHYTFQFIAPDRRAAVISRVSGALAAEGTLICVGKEVPSVSLTEAPGAAAVWLEKTKHKLRAEGLDSILPAALYEELLRDAANGRTLRRVSNPSSAELADHMRRAGLSAVGKKVIPLLPANNERSSSSGSESSVILVATRPDSQLETLPPLG